MLSRREWLRYTLSGAAASLVVGALPADLLAAGSKPGELVIYKSPTCGCCHLWMKHMEQAGFTFTVHDINDVTAIKNSLGVPTKLQSCHTAIYGKYLLEGHVPADLVKKLAAEKPALLGLAVPGMPAGSPGMEMGGSKDPYDVVAFDRKGKTWTYAKR